MATFAVVLREDVKKEGLHVIVEGLVVQEQLGQQTQVLTVDCAHVAVDLWEQNRERIVSAEHGDSGPAVHL